METDSYHFILTLSHRRARAHGLGLGGKVDEKDSQLDKHKTYFLRHGSLS